MFNDVCVLVTLTKVVVEDKDRDLDLTYEYTAAHLLQPSGQVAFTLDNSLRDLDWQSISVRFSF